MSDNEQARIRFQDLISIASKSSMGVLDDGNLSRADFDELSMLARYLGPQLPNQVHNLLGEGFPSGGPSQVELAVRLSRVLEFVSKYGEIEVRENGSNLLPTFTLQKKDKERVLTLCSDIRKIVFSSPDFDEPHKKRLLNRIAAIESQVHSQKGMFDVILGGVSDVGETLGKFGKDIKPLSDRMAEIARITRQTTPEYEQIPAPEEIKRLPAPEENGDEE